MTTNSKASLALIIGTLAGLVTMSVHPTGRELAADLAGGGHGVLNIVAHSVALLAQPLILMGLLVLTLRLTAQRDIAIAAYILFAWASVAIMLAATASGLIATSVLAADVQRQHVTPGAAISALQYTGLLNRAFAKVYVAFSSLAIVLWSVAMLRTGHVWRGLGTYGVVGGLAMLAGIMSGHLGVGIHGFGAVVLSQGIWLVWTAALLRRAA